VSKKVRDTYEIEAEESGEGLSQWSLNAEPQKICETSNTA